MLMSKPKAAKYIGICSVTFDRHVKEHLTAYPIGPNIYFKREEVDEWLESVAQKGTLSLGSPRSGQTKGRAGRAGGSGSPEAASRLTELSQRQQKPKRRKSAAA
jgi:hypothetical protein